MKENVIGVKAGGKIIFVVVAISLFILSSFSFTATSNLLSTNEVTFQLIEKEVTQIKKFESCCNGGLIDNVPIKCRGIYLEQILAAILWQPVFYIHFMYSNENNVPISINQHVTVTGRNGQILYDFDHNFPFKLNPNWSWDTQFMRRIELKDIGYMFGPIDITFYFKIPDDNSSVRLLFHGFIYNIGAVIFNPEGEKLE